MKKSIILKRLNEITSYSNFSYLIANITYRDFCGTLDELSTKDNRNHLNYNEVNLLIGFWLKNFDSTKVFNTSSLNSLLEEVYDLMEKLHFTFISGIDITNLKEQENPFDFFQKGILFQEAMFYSGTGAYDYQYTKWVTEKYKYDKDWLRDNRKLNLDLIPQFYDSIKKLQQLKLNSPKRRDILDVFCLTREEILNLNKEYENILDNFIFEIGIDKNENFNDLGDFNISSEKPIIKLENNKYFIPSPFYLSEAIYESPYYWMNSDKTYIKKSHYNRGKIAEEITYDLVSRIFGENNTFQNVIIKKGKDMVTDIDIMTIHKNRGIIFQVKSKKLTSISKKGNLDSIKNDFKKAVTDAYKQGLKCINCLNNRENFKFEFNGEKNYNFPEELSEFYVVTIVLDNYPAITHQTHILLAEEFYEFPVAVNIFDLEVIARYLNKPEKFTDYISKRVKFSKYFKAENELCFLGFHMEQGLKKYKDGDLISLDESWAQIFDKKYYEEIANLKPKNNSPNRKIGRNEKCPCGSNLKYKKCHGKNN